MDVPVIPNTGRILDVWLGGQHHTSADHEAAQLFSGIYERFPEVFQTLRQYIVRASQQLHQQGIDRFLVLGAGIPSCGNVHEAVPNARVLYTDIDPYNIELGKQLLENTSRADYSYCDANDFSTCDKDALRQVLETSDTSPIGYVVVGITVFMRDEAVSALFQSLYEHAPAGSRVIFDLDSHALSHFPEALAILGDNFHMRTPEDFATLIQPWRVSEPGIQPVQSWNNHQPNTDLPVFMYGGIAKK
ncbi:SAM-dependent methyltransferase [Kistimonas asteriae]|uniref:SAM-dependent methyltransferase n=1 Tax=Kistimonas asteriae TaxID=517724 RepID=UPI001BA7A49F|nr:SAM-dependent methyltransferase [Kistimonas asteriae]